MASSRRVFARGAFTVREALIRHSSSSSGASASSVGLRGSRILVATSATAVVTCVGVGSKWYFDRTRNTEIGVEDIELPLVPEPSGHFVHPYDVWPWHHQLWFALKRAMFLVW